MLNESMFMYVSVCKQSRVKILDHIFEGIIELARCKNRLFNIDIYSLLLLGLDNTIYNDMRKEYLLQQQS